MFTFGGLPLVEPRLLYPQCARLGLDLSWFGRANSFRCRLGAEPGVGWLLMSRLDYGLLDPDSTHDLVFGLSRKELSGAKLPPGFAESVTVKSLLVVGTASLTPGLRGDDAETLLLQVADRRWLYQNIPINISYNVPEVPDGTYYADTTNGGTPYTWAEVGQDLWETVGTDKLGAWPGLPFTPHGTPVNLRYFGGSALAALDSFLSRLGCALVWNPFTDAFSIVLLGVADADLEQFLTDWDGWRVHDSDPRPEPRATIPETIRVLFRKVPHPPGESPFHAADVATPDEYLTGAARAAPDTCHTIHDDLPLYYDSGGTPQNSSDVNDRADERAEDYARVLACGLELVQRTFALPVGDPRCVLGSRVWDIEWLDHGRGFQTILRRAPEDWVRKLGFTPLRNEEVDQWSAPWSSGSGITVKEQDGTPSYASTTTIEVNQADGLVLTQPSANTVLVSIQDAGAAQVGIVSTGAQTFAGVKRFADEVLIVSNDGLTVYYGEPNEYTQLTAGKSGLLYGEWLVKDDGVGVGSPSYASVRQSNNAASSSLSFRHNGSEYAQVGYLVNSYFLLASGGYFGVGSDVGDTGTDALGNEYVGGICTTVGAGTIPAAYTDEQAQDACATMIQNGTGITWSYNDGANTLTPTVTITQYTDDDAIAAVLAQIAEGLGIQLETVTGVGVPDTLKIHREFRGCRAYRSAAFTITSANTWTSIGLDAETFDTDAIHDNSTNNSRFTIPTGMDGYWRFTARAYGDYATSGIATGKTFALRILHNGTTDLDQDQEWTGAIPGDLVTAVRNFSAGDYVELQALSESANMQLLEDASTVWMECEFLGKVP